jgi:hypothetical protein
MNRIKGFDENVLSNISGIGRTIDNIIVTEKKRRL